MKKRYYKVFSVLLILVVIFINGPSSVVSVKAKELKSNEEVGVKEIYFETVYLDKKSESMWSPRPNMMNTYILTANNELWGYGTNEKGQLGKKKISQTDDPVKIISDVKSFHASNNIFYVIKTNGELWGWGENKDGVIGSGKKGVVKEPVKILDNVVEIDIDGSPFYALTENKDLYIWGNSHVNYEDPVKTKPIKILEGVSKLGKPTYGPQYAIVNDDELWTWGWHTGAGTDMPLEKPTKILDGVKDAIYNGSSSEHFYIIKKNGELWGWTSDYDRAVIGNGKMGVCKSPVKILDNVAEVFPDSTNTLALKKNGELWGWGSNYDGSLGNGQKGAVLKPTKILDGVSRFINNYGTYFIINNKSELWAWGSNDISPIGDGSQGRESFGTPGVKALKPKKIMSDVKYIDSELHALAEHISPLIIKSNDELWGWGNHIDGYTYWFSEQPLVPRKLKENVAYGGYDLGGMNYIVTKNNELWVWGDYSNNRGTKTADNVKEIIVYDGIHVLTEEGEFWINCNMPGVRTKLSDNVAKGYIGFGRDKNNYMKQFYGIVKENGDAYVGSNSVSSNIYSTEFTRVQDNQVELKKIILIDK